MAFGRTKNPVVILECPKSMLEYYFEKVITLSECNVINLEELPNEVKDIIHAENTENSETLMICTTTIPSKSNTIKNLAVRKGFHSSFI